MVVSPDRGHFYGETRASAETPHLRVVLRRYRIGESTPLHAHAEPYLALVVRGAFRQHARSTETLCTPGWLVIDTGSEEHRDRIETEVSEVIGFEPPRSWLEALRDEQGRDPGFAWLTRRGLRNRALALRSQIEDPRPLSEFVVEGAAAELLAIAAGVRCRDGRRSRPPAWLQRVEDAVQARFRDPPSLSELGVLASRSPSQIVRGFRRWRGSSLGDFARRLRAEHARRALVETATPLLEIALEAGYSDQSHMTRELGAYFGCTPARLRRSRAH